MNNGNIDNQAITNSPSADIAEAISGLWDIVKKSAEKLDFYSSTFSELKQEKEEYKKAFEAIKAEKNMLQEKLESIPSLSEKYNELVSNTLPNLENQLLEEKNKADLLELEKEKLKLELEEDIESRDNFHHVQKELARKNHELNKRADQMLKYREEISNLESKVIELENRTKESELEDDFVSRSSFEDVKEKLNQKDIDLNSSDDKVMKLREKISDLENEMKESELDNNLIIGESIEHVREELILRDQELEEEAVQILNLNSRIIELEKMLIDIQNGKNNDEVENAYENMKAEIESLHKKNKELESQKYTILEQSEELQLKLDSNEKEYSSKIEELTDKYDEQNKQFEQIYNEYETISQEKNDIEIQFDELISKKEKNEHYASEISEKLSLFQERVNIIEKEKLSEIAEFQSRIDDLKNERNENENQIRTNLEVISKLEYKLKRLEPECDQLKERIILNEKELDIQKANLDKVDELENETGILSNNLLIKENAISELKEKVNELEVYKSQLELKKQSLIEAKKQTEEKDSEVWNLTNEIESLKQVSVKDKKKLIILSNQIDYLHKSLKNGDSEIIAGNMKITELEETITKYEQIKSKDRQKKELLLAKIEKQLPMLEQMIESK